MKKILIIHTEQEEDCEYLSELESSDYNTYLTSGESDGLKIADRYLPDIIICELDNYEKELKLIEELNESLLTETIPLILITSTSQLQHIRTAIELGADDILVKPFKYESLLRLIKKRLRKIELIKAKLTEEILSTENVFNNNPKRIDHILIKIGKRLKLIEFSRIVCISALKEYSKIITDDGGKFLVRKSIRNWVDTLPSKDFLRIHRATIINISFLDKIEKSGIRNYDVYLKNIPTPFPLSQRYGNIMRKTFSA